jgi:hypothetical protein
LSKECARGKFEDPKSFIAQSRDQKFTIKRYHSEKGVKEGDQCRHKKIILSSDNRAFRDIMPQNVTGDGFSMVAEFIAVLPPKNKILYD